MKWKWVLFGYRKREVEEYVQNLAENREKERGAYNDRIMEAEVTRLQREIALKTLRQEADARRAQLDEVESSLIRIYYKFIQSQTERGPDQDRRRAETDGKNLSRREERKMGKQRALNTSFIGVAPKNLTEYLISREQEHEELISSLSDKLNGIEKAIESQNEEIRKLEERLNQPEMQKSFIDMAERFLTRFERILQETVRRTMKPESGGPGDGGPRGGLPEQETAGSDYEDERLQERELIMQIAKNRRKIKELLRNMEHWKDGVTVTDLATPTAVVADAMKTTFSDGSKEGAEKGAKAGVDDTDEADADDEDEIEDVDKADGAVHDLDAKGRFSAEPDFDEEGEETNIAFPAAYDAVATAASIIGINAAYSAAIKAASIAEDDGADNAATEIAAVARDRSLRLMYLMDKHAGEDLKDEYGRVLIRKGDPVYMDTAEEIDRKGLMDQLIKNLA
jgi:hypothetical protein